LVKNNKLKKEDIGLLTFPLLAKPAKESGGGLGILKIDDSEELKVFVANTKDISNYVFQEYIDGYDMGCNVLCLNGAILAHTIQRGFLWDNSPFAPQIGLTFEENDELLNLVESLMKSLNWSGVANVDIRFDINIQKFKIIEINPRYWATIEGSLLSGVNFPYLHCMLSMGKQIAPPKHELMQYLTLKGLLVSVLKKPQILLKPKFIWNSTPLKFLMKDPFAILNHYFLIVKNILWNKTKSK
jgi:predicted ATP-grasp superfamily ATP-dependent carboligase